MAKSIETPVVGHAMPVILFPNSPFLVYLSMFPQDSLGLSDSTTHALWDTPSSPTG